MKKEFVRNPYNYDSDALSTETGLRCMDESLTQQQFLEESDINYIAAKFIKTGEVPQVLEMPTGGDFQGIFDFQSAMNLITDAKQQFMTLPAKVRSRFDNDPAKLIEFIENEDNRKEAEILGLIQPKEIIDEPGTPKPAQGPTQGATGTTGATTTTTASTGSKKPGRQANQDDRGGDQQKD